MWALTVAAIIEREGHFLFVEEPDKVTGLPVINQPAGHVEPGEALLDAVRREVHEETGLAFTPEAIVGIYPLLAANGKDYLRVCFWGTVPEGANAAPQDADILRCHWLTREELRRAALRSGWVLGCLDDALAGRRFPLELVANIRVER
ncbi:NUDIX domain-containing protein [Geothrix sp. PMB-07]|uniref:NUDIX domain-containing protein n=1 Tax=Geothrix sp. PMB-07 TaxID=3068640 RepID=UPI002741DA4B|nr:NUDIX hydrolase [Geothrix sp. PMB-07]WLT32304.1 NUDIX hydrolase [Geothrix sp. PMB-07]